MSSTVTIVRGATEIALETAESETLLLVSPTGSRAELTVAGGPPGPPGADAIGIEATLTFIIEGGGIPITPGAKPGLDDLPFNAEILSWTLTGDPAGSIVIDLLRSSFAAYPPGPGDSITGTEQPELMAALASQSNTLAGWNLVIAKGDSIVPDVISATTIERATLTVRVRRT